MKLDIKRIRKRKIEGNKMSIKLKGYSNLSEWAISKGMIGARQATSSSINYDNRCSHCNNIITPGESHIPYGDLNVPSRGGSCKFKQCVSIRMH